MFDEPLPKESDVRKLVIKQAEFESSFSAKHLTRFASATENDQACIHISLRFFLDEQKRYRLSGKVNCETSVICQRCLGPMPLSLDCQLDTIIVNDDEQAKQLPRTIEPLVVADGELIDLNEVVEDELLLNMPYAMLHEDETCYRQQHVFLDPDAPAEEPAAQESDVKKDNPFSLLSQLKDD
jgi:uncharacterized protein